VLSSAQRRGRVGIARRVILATLAFALIIAAAFALLLVTIVQTRTAERKARHSQDVLIAANGLEQLVLDLESGQRGYLLTRQIQFLAPWQQARTLFPQQSRTLEALVSGNAPQQARVRKIVADTKAYIDDYSLPLIRAAERGDPTARTIPPTAEGEARVNAIRAVFDQFIAAEHRTAVANDRQESDAAHRAYIGAVVGIAASIALVVLYAGYLSRAIVTPIRRAAALAGRLAGGDLAARSPETGVGEIGELQQAFNAMGASLERGRDELAALAAEQGALRRVATLVAQGVPPDQVLATVAAEVGQLFAVEHTLIGRYDAGGTEMRMVGVWRSEGGLEGLPETVPVGGRNLTTLVWETQRPARFDPEDGAYGASATYYSQLGISASVGVPIVVEGRLWGLAVVATSKPEPLPDDTEARLGRFTELVSTAIANAESQEALTASRARIVLTADQTRRRFERDLHDGAQQKFVAATLRVRNAQAEVPSDQPGLAGELDDAVAELTNAIDELRVFAQGIHPAILAEGGLGPALRKLARQSAVPVVADLHLAGRLPEPVEIAAYYVASEALTNAAKHGHASSVTLHAEVDSDRLQVMIQDDGVGGARMGGGSGLIGLKDRVEALGGRLTLKSEPGAGTSLAVELPLTGVDA
jgi:signal transduction histidine kinase